MSHDKNIASARYDISHNQVSANHINDHGHIDHHYTNDKCNIDHRTRIKPTRLCKQTMNTVTCEITGKSLKYRHLAQSKHAKLWQRSFSNELGRLANGIPPFIKTGTNTIEFITVAQIPANKQITYGRIVVVEKNHTKHKGFELFSRLEETK